MAFRNTFDFIGNILVPNDEKKLYTETVFDSKWAKHQLKIGIKASNNNGIFVDTTAMIPPSDTWEMTKPKDTSDLSSDERGALDREEKLIKIPFKDRLDKGVVALVSDFAKFTIDMETDEEVKHRRIELFFKIKNTLAKEDITDEDKEKLEKYQVEFEEKSVNRHEFIHEYDFINFIKDNLEVLKKHKVRMTGNYTKSTSKGKYYSQYAPSMVEIVPEETENNLSLKLDIFFNKDVLDLSSLKDTKKIYINGYIMNRDGMAKADRFFPQTLVLDCSNIDPENEMQMGLLEIMKGYFDVKKTYHHMLFECALYRGAEEKPFTYAELTKSQKALVDINIKCIDDFKPRGGKVLGNNVDEIKVMLPILEGDFANGQIDSTFKEEEFIKLVSVSSEDISLTEAKKTTEPVKQEEKKPDASDAFKSLFGGK